MNDVFGSCDDEKFKLHVFRKSSVLPFLELLEPLRLVAGICCHTDILHMVCGTR